MVFWQRLLLTLIAILATSFIVGWIWSSFIPVRLPGYFSGVIGGLTAVPVWEFLKKISPKTGT